MEILQKNISVSLLETNDGQVAGLPANPREIQDERFEALKKSIIDAPSMLSMRELLVYPYNGKYVIVGGNMRFRACLEIGYKELPCKIIPADFTPTQLREITIKDNENFGRNDWEKLAAEWNFEELKDWGMEMPEDWENAEAIENGEEGTQVEAEEDDFDEDSDDIPKRCELGDVWQLGDHRLICGDSTDVAVVKKLLGSERADLYLTDPPYNVDYTGGTKDALKIANDKMADKDFRNFLILAFSSANEVMKEGAAFYIWHADSEGFNFRGACRDVEWKVRECLIWNKNALVMGRQDYQWKHEPCQPAGTMVLTTAGEKPIEELTDADRVISYDSLSGQIVGYKNGGYEIKTAHREYDGLLYTVAVGLKATRCTDNHQFSVRFNREAKANYCTYLMRRGDWWRVGIAKCYDARQFGLKTRFHQKHADEMWLLSVHRDKIEAQVAEQIITVKYGIPYTVWEQDRFTKAARTKKQIEAIYEALDLSVMRDNAHRLLHDFGRSERFPFINKESKSQRFSTRVTVKIHACNLVPEIMQLPIPTSSKAYPNFKFASIDSVSYEKFKGTVYSLAVSKHQHYIADGIVTHNCLYGWKEGAAHKWYSDRSQTTVLDFPKPTRSEMYPTMKPIPLFAYLVQNSTKEGDIVLDNFGGSGTTMMACEQLKRKARLIELDPHYCDVILARWESFTNQKAIKL